MVKHYIGMSGNYGCLPDYLVVLSTIEGVAQSLALVHQLSERKTRQLQKNKYLTLKMGADYAEIIDCDCEDVECLLRGE